MRHGLIYPPRITQPFFTILLKFNQKSVFCLIKTEEVLNLKDNARKPFHYPSDVFLAQPDPLAVQSSWNGCALDLERHRLIDPTMQCCSRKSFRYLYMGATLQHCICVDQLFYEARCFVLLDTYLGTHCSYASLILQANIYFVDTTDLLAGDLVSTLSTFTFDTFLLSNTVDIL